MTATYSAEDYALAQAHITTDPWATRMLAREFAALRTTHDARVTELLDANNRYLERARAAERDVVFWKRAAQLVTEGLGKLATERDAARNDTLEEAAKVAETSKGYPTAESEAIRALKDDAS